MKNNIYLTIGVLLILVTSLTPASASVVITENFDGDLTGWDLNSSTRDSDGVFNTKTNEINNDNGVFQFPEECCNFDDVHMRALKRKVYVLEREEFVDGSVRHMISIENKGIDEYSKLKEILINFVDSTEIEIDDVSFDTKNKKDKKTSQGFDLDDLS